MFYFWLVVIIGLSWWGLYTLWGKYQNLKLEHKNSEAELESNKNQLDAFASEISELNTLKTDSVKLNNDFAKKLDKIGEKYFKENIKEIFKKLTTNNFATSHKRIESIITFLEKNGYKVPNEEKSQVLLDLKNEYKNVVRKDFLKKEQQRIKEMIREEQRLEKERERELKRLENEELAIEKALQNALKKAKDEHDVEVERLRQLLSEAEEKSERAKSQAQLTKAGHVYVISNIGSFGKNVFKIGMTRRLVPNDRVRELGDASVPFPFDVHMMISCENAPALENTLHREFHKARLNKINTRKEFFKVELEQIKEIVEKYHGNVEYEAEPEALEYYESINMSEDDDQFVSEQLEEVERKLNNDAVDETFDKVEQKESTTPVPPRKKTMPCPRCKKPLALRKIVSGKNTCQHCNQSFTAKTKAS